MSIPLSEGLDVTILGWYTTRQPSMGVAPLPSTSYNTGAGITKLTQQSLCTNHKLTIPVAFVSLFSD